MLTCDSLDAVAAINSIDKTSRVKSAHQLIVDNILDPDVCKARFPRLCESLDIFHALERWVRLAVQTGEDFLIAFFRLWDP
jgi:hypothetical protein